LEPWKHLVVLVSYVLMDWMELLSIPPPTRKKRTRTRLKKEKKTETI